MSSSSVSRNFSSPNDSSCSRDEIKEEQNSPESTEKEDSNDTTQPLSDYEQLRVRRIKRNRDRLIQLRLISVTDKEQQQVGHGFLAAAMGRTSLNNSSPGRKRRSPSDENRAPVRKSPCSSNNSSPSVSTPGTRTSPRLAAMRRPTIVNDPPESVEGEETTTTSSTTTSTGRAVVYKQRTWFTSHNGKEVYEKGVTKKKLLLETHGEKVLHPMRLKRMKIKEGMVLPDYQDAFTDACLAFICYHAESLCKNLFCNYQTQCSCLKGLVESENGDEQVKQLADSMYNFFSRPKLTQKLVMKEWIRANATHQAIKQQSCFKVHTNYMIPGVFHDADTSNNDASKNTEPFCVCQNSLFLIYNYGFKKFKNLKKDLYSSSIRTHGLVGKKSNYLTNKNDERKDIDKSLHKFFTDLMEEAETHSSRVICEAAGVGLRDDEINLVELPSSFTSRQLYYRWCYSRGYCVKADAQGKLPKISDYLIREYDEVHWPHGSVPLPVCARIYFQNFWKQNYNNLKIRKPSHDTCNECWQYKNELGRLSRLANKKHDEEYVSNQLETLTEEVELNSGDKEFSDDEDAEEDLCIEHDNNNVSNNLDVTNNEAHVKNYSECQRVNNVNSEDDMAPLFVRDEEQLVSKYYFHVKQFTEMRDLVRDFSKKGKKHHDENVVWEERSVVEFGDYAQNMDMPHFGSEQPGDIYYYSPLGIYVFGLVDTSGCKSKLTAFYYKEGVGKKGGNNVASLLWKNANSKSHIKRSEQDGALNEYVLTMDNCGGQNKNRMVIRFLLMMTELKVYNKVWLIFLVRGHTKNPCDRMYMLLKQRFHYKNVYTMKQLHDNLNSNEDVNAIESTKDDFYDFDTMLAKYYDTPQSGSVNRSHIFLMDSEYPGKLLLKDNVSAEESAKSKTRRPH